MMSAPVRDAVFDGYGSAADDALVACGGVRHVTADASVDASSRPSCRSGRFERRHACLRRRLSPNAPRDDQHPDHQDRRGRC